MIDRITRAIRLDRTLFRQVADNPEYMNEAVLIAVIVSLVVALGTLFGTEQPLLAFFGRFASEIIFGWLLWGLVAYFVGTALFKGRSSPAEMLRTLAYAGTPRLLGVFGLIPCVGWILAVVGWVLAVIAGVIAIRESMEFDTTQAVITAVIGFALYVLVTIGITLFLAPFVAFLR
jgi:hypothetical protein